MVNSVKLAGLQYSSGPHGPGNQVQPYGKTLPATYSAEPRKGQKINPLKHSDVPVEVRTQLRRKNSDIIANLMAKAGGPTSPEGDAYAAVLEERGINPNLAGSNLNMARTTPNDVYFPQKTASRIYRILS